MSDPPRSDRMLNDIPRGGDLEEYCPLLLPVGDDACSRLGLAQKLMSQGLVDESLVELDAALEENPELAGAYGLKGLLFAATDESEAAARCLEIAESLDPDEGELWFTLASAWKRLDRGREALNAVDRAIARGYDEAAAHVLRGDLLLEAGRKEAALQAFHRAVSLDRQVAEAHRGIAELLYEADDLPGALRSAAQASHLDPIDIPSRLLYGDLLRDSGDWEQAIEEYRAATKIDPGNAEPFSRMGMLYLDRDRMMQAIGALQAAVARDPTLTSCYAALGRIYRGLERPREAEAMFRRAEDSGGDAEVRREEKGGMRGKGTAEMPP